MALRLGLTMPAKKTPQFPFGQRLATLRQARGLTQTQLADALGVTQHSISRLETVVEFPTVQLLLGICAILKASADELLGLKPAPKVEPIRQPPEEKRLWRHLKTVASLPERDQRAVLRLIDSAATAAKSRRVA